MLSSRLQAAFQHRTASAITAISGWRLRTSPGVLAAAVAALLGTVDPAAAQIPPAVTVSYSPSTILSGAITTGTITITNPNNSTLTSIQAVLTQPIGVSNIVALGPATCNGVISVSATTYTVNASTLAAGASCNGTFTATSSAIGTHVSFVQVTSNQAPPAFAPPAFASATLTVVPYSPLGVALSFSPSTILSGATATGTITLTNPNAAGLTGVVGTLVFPVGVSAIVALGAATCNGVISVSAGQYTVNATLAAGASCNGTFTATSTSLGAHVLTATGTSTQGAIGSGPAILNVVAQYPTATHDFNGNSKSDIAWRDTSGNTAFWLMNGTAVSSSAVVGAISNSWTVVGQRDFSGDGKTDLLWRDTSGNTAMWVMNGSAVTSSISIGNVPTTWAVAGTGDFDSDGKGDIVWRDNTGNVAIWLMNGGTIASSVYVGNLGTAWNIAGSSRNSILWRDTSGNAALWLMNGGAVGTSVSLGNVPTSWSIAGTGDFDGAGNLDILWRDTAGNVAIWFLNGSGGVTSTAFLGNIPITWSIAETGDFNGDGKSDILWRDTSGNIAMWLMNGSTVTSSTSLGNVATTWSIQGAGAD